MGQFVLVKHIGNVILGVLNLVLGAMLPHGHLIVMAVGIILMISKMQ
jgi:hypothetical protein